MPRKPKCRPADDYRARDTLIHERREIDAGERFPLARELPDDVPDITAKPAFIYNGRLFFVRAVSALHMECTHGAPGTSLVNIDDLVARRLLCPPEGCDDPDCATAHGAD